MYLSAFGWEFWVEIVSIRQPFLKLNSCHDAKVVYIGPLHFIVNRKRG